MRIPGELRMWIVMGMALLSLKLWVDKVWRWYEANPEEEGRRPWWVSLYEMLKH